MTEDTKTPAPTSAPEPRSGARVNAVLATALVALIVLMANYLAFRHYARWDLTSDRHFTLSSKSREVARRLDRDVTLYLFLSRIEENYDDVRELVRRYEAASSHVHVKVVDPDRDRGRYQILARRFGLGTVTTEDGMAASNVAAVVEAGSRNYKIERSDLVSVDFGGGEERAPEVDVKSERAITSALVEVTSGRNAKVCVSTGHGEWELEGVGGRSLATLADEFQLDNIDLAEVGLEGRATVPADCDALYVIGPQRLFAPEEAEVLAAYVRGGGHLLLALDPVLRETSSLAPTGLEGMLHGFGIDLGTDLVLELDPDHLLGSSPTEGFVANAWGGHSLVRELAATQGIVAMHMARSLTVEGDGPSTILLTTTDRGYAERDLASLQQGGALAPGAGDARGPVGLAAVYPKERPEGEGPHGALVVVGDTDWLRSEALSEPRFANVDFVSAITGFLAARPSMISIAPRRTSAQALVMTTGDLLSIKLRVIGLLPLAFVLLGFSVWWTRRA
ncbi:MAG: GldG family protein [Polyangiales bacterium]